MAAAGCNIGNAPEPMSGTDVKSAVEQLPPEKQIEWYQRSPMPPAEKQAKINEIKKKAGMPVDEGPAAPQGAPSIPSGGGK